MRGCGSLDCPTKRAEFGKLIDDCRVTAAQVIFASGVSPVLAHRDEMGMSASTSARGG